MPGRFSTTAEQRLEMQRYLHDHIPITAHLGVEISDFADNCITLFAPLAANINHRDTAFGGSISSVGILAGWSILHFTLTRLNLASRIVIQKSGTDFTAPGDGDFTATARLPEATEWEQFTKMLQRKGRARIAVSTQLSVDHTNIAQHEGLFVAILNERL